MKHNLLLLGALLTGSVMPILAAHVTPEQALQRVQGSRNLRAVKGELPSSPKFDTSIGNLYVFTSDRGYMILPNNDESPALLGYSEKGNFNPEENPGLKYWLDFYNRELNALGSAPKSSSLRSTSRPERAAIPPLTKTRWNQSAPYNDSCPEVNGQRTVTGCVATAMAQVMKYHNYPEKGKGSRTYSWNGTDLTCDFSNTTFEWDKMTNTYDDSSSAESKEAVATLMSACGISVDMEYGVAESSASSIKMGASLIDFFDYDKGLWMPMRDYYGIYDWEDMVYSDLAQGLPVLYSGQGTAGGHQFICDGYSGDGYFHFNWGWGGMSDGYFLLTALNPASLGVGGGAGGFNSYQMICLGVQPPKADSQVKYIMYNEAVFEPAVTEVAAGSRLLCTGFFINNSLSELPDGSWLGMKITPADGGDPTFVRGYGISKLPNSSGYKEDEITLPELPDGNYVITPAFYDGSKWSEIPSPLGSNGKINAQVSNNVAYISVPQTESIEVTDVTVPSTVYIDKEFPMSFNVTNPNSDEYIGKVIPVLFNVNGSQVGESVYRPVDILGNSEENVDNYVGEFKTVPNVTLTAGQYILVFFDEYENQISNETPINLEVAPAQTEFKVTDFGLVSPNPVTDVSNVEFTFHVTCTEGYFSDKLQVAIFPSDGGMSLIAKATGNLFLNAGEEKDVNVSIDLTSLKAGRYMAVVFHGQDEESNSIYIDIPDISTGIEEIVGEESEQTIYNLDGVRCNKPLTPGIYIINGKTTLVR